MVGGETVADSRNAFVLHESGHQPIYYFPPEDVRSELLEPSDRHTRCPKKGEASYYTIRAGDSVVEAGAWYYPELIADAPPASKGLIAFYWNRMDQWFEEDEEVFVHPRDPYHRVDVVATDRHVRVSLDGVELLAETDRAMALFESNLPPRWYMPARGRGRCAGSSRHGDALPVQGRGALLLGQAATRRQGPHLVLRRAARRGGADRRAAVLLQRAGRLELDGEDCRAARVALEPRREVGGAERGAGSDAGLARRRRGFRVRARGRCASAALIGGGLRIRWGGGG